MKMLAVTTVVAAGVLAVSGLFAQAARPRPDRNDRGRMVDRPGPPRGHQGPQRLMRILNAEQRDQAREIFRDARQRAADADTPDQRRKIMRKAHEKIKALLTDEQKAKIAGMRRARRLNLELTDDQKAQVKEIYRAAQKKMEGAENLADKIKINRRAQRKLVGVLTDDQRAKLKKFQADRPGLNLTDQQKAVIAEIRKTARLASALAAGPGEKRRIAESARKDVLSVLTRQQRAKYQKLRKRGGRRGRDRMWREGDRRERGRMRMGPAGQERRGRDRMWREGDRRERPDARGSDRMMGPGRDRRARGFGDEDLLSDDQDLVD